MSLQLLKQAVYLIKRAEDNKPSAQSEFYSNPDNAGLAMYPRGVIDRTEGNTQDTFGKQVSQEMQRSYSEDGDNVRSGNVVGEWKDFPAGKYAPEEYATNMGIPEGGYTYNIEESSRFVRKPGEKPYININFKEKPIWINDLYNLYAHENTHREQDDQSQDYRHYLNYSSYNKESPIDMYKRGARFGAYLAELPAIVQEMTYGRGSGNVVPRFHADGGLYRNFTNNDDNTDSYFSKLFPKVHPSWLKSEPGKVYRYWHAPDEPNVPKEGYKRLIPDTPSGWWVNQFGDWERTGGDVIDADYYFKKPANIATLPPNLQRFFHNMKIFDSTRAYDHLNRKEEVSNLTKDVRNLLAPLGLRTPTPRYDGGGFGSPLWKQMLNYFNYSIDNLYGDEMDFSKEYDADALSKADVAIPPDANYFRVQDYIDDNPRWDPNNVIEPIPIGMAGLQKKYNIHPLMTFPTDVRTPQQLKAIKRDAQHCYDLQDYLNRYGDHGGGQVGS